MDIIIIGTGFAGAVIAERAAKEGKKVLVIEKKEHIAGNMYDFYDQHGILVHKYGPHLFHTNSDLVAEYIKQFGEFFNYSHKVLGYVSEQLVPIPFNKTSIETLFKDRAKCLISKLVESYGDEVKVPILDLLNNDDLEIKELANFIYENVFKYYTMKQWDLLPTEIDPAVTKRVPVSISYDDRYFGDKHQFMPKDGFTSIFKNMLEHENIEIRLNTDSKELLAFKDGQIFFNNELYAGEVVFTGQVDELFDFKYGELPYRSLEFVWENLKMESYQEAGTVNYPTPKEVHAFTRISEFKKFTMENSVLDTTTIITEYPYAYNRNAEKGNIPYYPVFTDENQRKYSMYVEESQRYKNLHLLGRLAEYKYYNMDAIIERALNYYNEKLGSN